MTRLTPEEKTLLQELRHKRPAITYKQTVKEAGGVTTGQHVSDLVAAAVGSWTFIITQIVILALWMIVNVVAYTLRWDPYPFILLNLALSFQAAFTAPIIMMSQNRQAKLDRVEQQHDFDINIKAELEIESLHHKVDVLTTMVETLTSRLNEQSRRDG